ncbi:glutathione ABC transporter substrate-binding protein [Halalkalibacterium ligniniphilum]|uniref:glutathione ABC transporter substrate-binding protein n=1 Tax=Halalkalibacterium ligniniphilum TaxID=1134413 RepID=UPI000344F3EB|nr:glutathione ABC transporter substrate-binding protein [Halalkalibacterium ligniniphilum]
MKVSKNSLLLMMLALMLSVVLAACASEPDGDSAPAEDADEEQATNGEGSGGDLVIATLSEAVSLDPHGSNDTPSTNIASNIYEQLVWQDENLELQPGLAESWEPIDETTWEFKLREGIKFHDGTEFNADAVKANIDRILDPEVASPRSFLFNMITEVEVVDPTTVRFHTEYPFAPLPAHLAHNGGGMISPQSIEEDYAAMEAGEEPGSVISSNPVGTGYFKFDEWASGQYVRLVNNPDYWGEPAKLDSVTFKVVPEDLTRIAELETGDSHISDPLSPSDVSRVENTEGLYVNHQQSVAVSYIGFNMDKEPFNDVRVRQAISMAIDKDQIIQGTFDGAGIPAIGPIAPNVFGYDESVEGLEYNVERAKELLAEAGYPDGFSTTISTNDNRERIDAATNVQAQLAEIGIDAEVEVVEWGAYLEQTASGNSEMFVLGWTTVTGDADYGLYPLFHSDNVGEPGNRTFLRDEELDALLLEARQTTDEAERLALYKEAQEKLVELAPMLFIHHQEFLLGVREEVKGLWQHPTQILMLHDVYIEE